MKPPKNSKEHRETQPRNSNDQHQTYQTKKSIVLSLSASLVHISHVFGPGMAAATSNANHTCRWTNLHKLINAHITCTEITKGPQCT